MSAKNQRFETFQEWVDHASTWLTSHPYYAPSFRVSCFDTLWRPCRSGADFMRARDENTFPVRWWWPDQRQDYLSERSGVAAPPLGDSAIIAQIGTPYIEDEFITIDRYLDDYKIQRRKKLSLSHIEKRQSGFPPMTGYTLVCNLLSCIEKIVADDKYLAVNFDKGGEETNLRQRFAALSFLP